MKQRFFIIFSFFLPIFAVYWLINLFAPLSFLPVLWASTNSELSINDGNPALPYETDPVHESTSSAWQEIEKGRQEVNVSLPLLASPRQEAKTVSLYQQIKFQLENDNPADLLNSRTELSWHTFLGSSSDDHGGAMVVDNEGNIYITGDSSSSWGTPINNFSGGINTFVAKLNSDGVRQWHTFLGSSAGYAIALDNDNNVYVTGYSGNWGDPIDAHAGQGDAFAAKLNSNGILQWNTFLGSPVNDYGWAIAVDNESNVYVAGTSGANWGTPVNGSSGYFDAFAAKLNTDGVRQWNTFMGGVNSDHGYAIAADNDGNVYVAGTSDTAWGTPVNAYAGYYDVFATKLNSSGVRQWHTFMGSSGSDNGRDVAVDDNGNVYVAGYSYTAWGQPVNAHAGGGWDAFATKLDSNGVRQWHTFVGSTNTDYGYDITLDNANNVYMAGTSFASWGTPDNAYTGNGDAFAVKLSNNGERLWNTFLGGINDDTGQAIAVDNHQNIYVAGHSNAPWNTPAINGYTGGYDAYVAKIGGPQISILGNNNIIVNDDSSPSSTDNTDFGDVAITYPITHTFTISNRGIEDLRIDSIRLSGNASNDFNIASILTPTIVSPGLTTTFQLGFNPSVLATRTATVTLEHNDPSDTPFQFAIQGIGCSYPTTVQNINDNGTGSLRQALIDVCTGGTIDFASALAGQTILLDNQLNIDKDLSIYGNVPITISGNSTTRVFNIIAGDVTFDSLTIADGYIEVKDCDENIYSQCGGGIMVHDNGVVVTVTNSTLTENRTPNLGGGIFNNRGRLVIQNSTLNNNSAVIAGGIYNAGGILILQNSTLSGNSGSTHSGGLFNGGGQLRISNSILANSPSGTDCVTNRILSTNDHNLIENTSTCGPRNGDAGNIIGVDPQLGPLGDYGGSTKTFALLPESRAINAGNPTTCLPTDQRGYIRLQDAVCDIGAYENDKYLLTVGGIGQGTVISNPVASRYLYGSMVTITAVANPGWTFMNWSGDMGGSDNPETVTITRNTVITATFNNDPPLVFAGNDQIVEAESLVMLDGSGSYDEDPEQTLSYGWIQTGGPSVNLSNSTAITPTFIAPTTSTNLTFTLTITDNYGLSGITDEVVITVLRSGIAINVQPNLTMSNVGDTITYTYQITNIGDTSLSDIVPIDDHLGNPFTTPFSLAPEQEISQTLTYTVIETDLPGPLVNTTFVSGTSAFGNPVSATATITVPLFSQPGLKAELISSVLAAYPGETIMYSLTLTNSGNVTLYDLSSVASVSGDLSFPDSFAPGTAIRVAYPYTVKATDLPGPLTNTMMITASPLIGEALSIVAETAVSLELYTIYIPIIKAR